MGSQKTRLAGLLIAAVGSIGMVGVTTGAAHAVVLNRVSPGYSDEAGCLAGRAKIGALPDVVATGACFYSATFPGTNVPSPDWYFRYAIEGN